MGHLAHSYRTVVPPQASERSGGCIFATRHKVEQGGAASQKVEHVVNLVSSV